MSGKPSKKQSSEKENSEKAEELLGLKPQGESRRIRAQSKTVGRRFRSETHRSAGRPESSSRQDPQDEGRSGWEKSKVVGAALPGRIRKRKVEVDGVSGRRRSGARGRLYEQPPGRDLNMGEVTEGTRAMLPKRLGGFDTQSRPCCPHSFGGAEKESRKRAKAATRRR